MTPFPLMTSGARRYRTRRPFVAGKAFLAYRRRGGQKRSPLPDFYIGAHAAVRRYRLLTRDGARYRTYFPTVTLIAPDREHVMNEGQDEPPHSD